MTQDLEYIEYVSFDQVEDQMEEQPAKDPAGSKKETADICHIINL